MVKAMTEKELAAVRKSSFGKHDRLIRRLLATIGERWEADSPDLYHVHPVEVKWLDWPHLSPVRMQTNDWLRLAILALGEYEISKMNDHLRESGGWKHWEE